MKGLLALVLMVALLVGCQGPKSVCDIPKSGYHKPPGYKRAVLIHPTMRDIIRETWSQAMILDEWAKEKGMTRAALIRSVCGPHFDPDKLTMWGFSAIAKALKK